VAIAAFIAGSASGEMSIAPTSRNTVFV